MSSRIEALRAIQVGDLVFGLGAGGQEKLLLVYRADPSGFSARHVTTQMKFRFDRNGMTQIYSDGGYVKIVSTAALPADKRRVGIELDRKMGSNLEYPDTKLNEAEIRFLQTYRAFFESHLLPDQ